MKYLLLAATLAACSPSLEASSVRVTSGPTDVQYHRSFESTLHGDVDFDEPERALIREAAMKWNRAPGGYIRLEVVFDLDYSSVSGLQEHVALRHNTVVKTPQTAPAAAWIDGQHPGVTVLAATATMRNGSSVVLVIVERIEPSHFVSDVTHEFGHVIGFPDAPTRGSIMSAQEVRGTPVPTELTEEDLALCRGLLFCR